jgi:hypothetical protein
MVAGRDSIPGTRGGVVILGNNLNGLAGLISRYREAKTWAGLSSGFSLFFLSKQFSKVASIFHFTRFFMANKEKILSEL